MTKRTLSSGPRSGSTNDCLALSLATQASFTQTPARTGRRPFRSRATFVGMSSGSDRRLAWRLATPVVGLLSGALFVVSAHNSEGTDLRPGRFTDLASLARNDAQQVAGLKPAGRRPEVPGRRVLSRSVDNQQVRKLNREAAAVKGPAGLEAVNGPGISITLSDAPQSTDQDTPDTVDNPNLLLVHQQDIQAVVNALWKGGAPAVAIQGQRVVSTTGHPLHRELRSSRACPTASRTGSRPSATWPG